MDKHIARVGGTAQVRTPRANAFTPRRRQRFLDALALCCNVKASAVAAGVNVTTVYNHRGKDATFAAQWREALDVGCDRLETLLIEHGGAGQPLEPADPERGLAENGADTIAARPFDFEKALKTLHYYRSRHVVRTPAPSGRAPTRESALAALDQAIAAAERRIRRRTVADA